MIFAWTFTQAPSLANNVAHRISNNQKSIQNLFNAFWCALRKLTKINSALSCEAYPANRQTP